MAGSETKPMAGRKSRAVGFSRKIALGMLNAWKRRALTAWRRERGYWRQTKNPPSQRQLMGAATLLIALPVSSYVAMQSGWMVWLSFSFSAFLAVSYATFFSRPHIFFFILLGLLVGRVAYELLFEAKDAAIGGDLVGALIVLAVGFYVMWWSRELKAGNAPNESVSQSRQRRRRR